MQLSNTKIIWPAKGKTVHAAMQGEDDSGYPVVVIRFTDGSTLTIEETGQAGSIHSEYRSGPATEYHNAK